jgi:ferritin-like protein
LAVELPLRVERREELVWLLAQAGELEHGLMCEYLFAQFTLKRTQQEGLSVEQLAKVAAWEAVLVEVTKQEMLHLALATNLLTAIGAAPHLHRPNFPILSRWYPPSTWNAPRGWTWTTRKASRPSVRPSRCPPVIS